MGTVKIVLLILDLLPSIVRCVRELEKEIPEEKIGQDKKEIVLQTLSVVEELAPEIQKSIPAISKIIDVVVSIFKKNGIFK